MTKRSLWFSLRASFWLIPVVAVVLSALAAVVLVRLDVELNEPLRRMWPEFLQTGPAGARQILATIGSSMITVVGVVFSITIVSLSLTANQYSPRVLRNFMRDWLNQTVLGVFAGVFVYSLLVLQAVGTVTPEFVPQLALGFAMVLAMISIGFLIAFIHHTATSIQVSDIIARITAETVAAFGAVRHLSDDSECATADLRELAHLHWQKVPSAESGYVQDVDVQALFQLACTQSWVVRVECAVGDFAVAGRPLVSVSGGVEVDDKFARRLQALFGINSYRTVEQDPAFGVRQIVDIALRALSPGINDSTTAVNCVDYLGVILHCAAQARQVPQITAEGGRPRVYLRQLTPVHLADIALNEIRQNASSNVAVLLRLLRMLRQLRDDVREPHLREHLRRHAELVLQEARRNVPVEADLAEIEKAFEKVLAAEPAHVAKHN